MATCLQEREETVDCGYRDAVGEVEQGAREPIADHEREAIEVDMATDALQAALNSRSYPCHNHSPPPHALAQPSRLLLKPNPSADNVITLGPQHFKVWLTGRFGHPMFCRFFMTCVNQLSANSNRRTVRQHALTYLDSIYLGKGLPAKLKGSAMRGYSL